ncbi:MAG: ABC transporter permease, partial [Candidatus Latescibacteria bacterium]|nr:ABC transporter permease [Candidatus Latescibacterota bacterium]
MRNFVAIYWKEMRSYFGSPVAYVMAGVFLLFSGFFFRNLVLQFNRISLTYLQQPQYAGRMPPINVNEMVVMSFFGVQFFIWLIITPMLTMRLYAEEKRSGTMELLMTSPITTWQTLLGKFVACFSLYVIIEIAAFGFLGILSVYTDIDWGPVFSACLAVLLLGGTFVSVGILAS